VKHARFTKRPNPVFYLTSTRKLQASSDCNTRQ